MNHGASATATNAGALTEDGTRLFADAALARVYTALRTMFRYRGWAVLEGASGALGGPGPVPKGGGAALVLETCDRLGFRLFGYTPTLRAVALFADTSAPDTRRRATRPAAGAPAVRACPPSVAGIEWAVRAADAESVARLGGAARGLPLVVLLLRADTAPGLRADASYFVDAVRLNAAHAAALRLEPWHVEELAVDPFVHADVPLHRRATATECARYPAAALPGIFTSDVCVRWLGLAVDEIVAIERDDGDRGRYLYLRRVTARAN